MVPWDKVKDYMHLECRILQRDVPEDSRAYPEKAGEIPEENGWEWRKSMKFSLVPIMPIKETRNSPEKDGWNRKLTRPSTPPPGDPVYKGTGKGRSEKNICSLTVIM